MTNEGVESLETLSGLAQRIAAQLDRVAVTEGVGDDYAVRIARAHALGIIDLLNDLRGPGLASGRPNAHG